MQNTKIQTANKQIKLVTLWGVIINIALAVIKTLAGLWAGSMALVADGIHSISDMATDVVVLLGIRFSSKEPDLEHPYGHGRAETFSALFVAIVLVIVGGAMIQQASIVIAKAHSTQAQNVEIGSIVFWIALLSVIIKELLFKVCKKVAVKTNSAVLYANAWHHRSDALSSIAVLVGFISVRFGYDHGDSIATIAVGLMIILVAVKIIGGCLHEFAESAVDRGTVKQIEGILASEKRVHNWHKLRTRSVGREIFLDLHILVDPQLNITEAHKISESLEKNMHDQIKRPVNIMIHVEPDTPELRR